MKLFNNVKRELRRSLTVMFLPHNNKRAFRINFTVAFLIFMFIGWSSITIWAGYVTSRHIDYWRIKTESQLMKLKLMFFAQQVKKSHEMLEQVRETDEEIRSLLKLKSKKAIVEYEGKGGPNKEEIMNLNKLLENKSYQLSLQDIRNQIKNLQRLSQKRLESYREVLTYVDKERSLHRSTPKGWPCIGHITSYFGFRYHPVYQNKEFHYGIDIANVKNTPIYSTAHGTVKLCEWQPGYGRLIVIEHGHGYRTYYGHLKKILVKPGDKIKRRQLIGLMGNSGTSTGEHCHYELHYKNKAINPMIFMREKNIEIAQRVTPRS